MPDIGEGVTEGEVVEWFVKPGDRVAEDDPMVEVMTDKATVTIGAPCDARIETLRVDVGAVAKVGDVLLTFDRAVRESGPSATAVGKLEDEVAGASLFSGSSSHAHGNGNGDRVERSAVRSGLRPRPSEKSPTSRQSRSPHQPRDGWPRTWGSICAACGRAAPVDASRETTSAQRFAQT